MRGGGWCHQAWGGRAAIRCDFDLDGRNGFLGFRLSMNEAERYSDAVGGFHKQGNAAYVDPDYIAQVRKKLKLDQREATAPFGGGVNAFFRYENGKTKPPLALVKLFKVLDAHPDLLEEGRCYCL